MEEYEENENNIPMDIGAFCQGLKEAWRSVPDQAFGFALDTIFNGYDLKQLSPEELQEMLDDFVLQNSDL